MLERVIELEKELGIKGYDWDNDSFRVYYVKPTVRLQNVLDGLYPNYYNNSCYNELDQINIAIDYDYNLVISTWDEEFEEINDAVIIKTNKDFRVIEKVLRAIEEV